MFFNNTRCQINMDLDDKCFHQNYNSCLQVCSNRFIVEVLSSKSYLKKDIMRFNAMRIIDNYNRKVRITTLLLTLLMLCSLILYMGGGTYNLKSDKYLRNFFIKILFSFRVFARNLLRSNHRGNI